MNTTCNLLYLTVTIKILTTALYVSDLSGSSNNASSLTQSSYPAVPTSSPSVTHSSPLLSPPVPSPPTTPSPTSSPSSSLVFALSSRKLRSASTGILTLSTSVPSQSRSLHRRPAFATSGPDLSQSMTEHQSSLPVYSEEAFSHLVSTGILNTIISTSYSIEPAKVGTNFGISTFGGTVKPPFINCIVLFGRWVLGISRGLQCEQQAPRQYNIPMAGNTCNPAMSPYAVLQTLTH